MTVQEKLDLMYAEGEKEGGLEGEKEGVARERSHFTALLCLVRSGEMDVEDALDHLEMPEEERALPRGVSAVAGRAV